MTPLTRLAAAAASNGLLTGQILFSLAFVGSCELPNWINGPREANACLERHANPARSSGSGARKRSCSPWCSAILRR